MFVCASVGYLNYSYPPDIVLSLLGKGEVAPTPPSVYEIDYTSNIHLIKMAIDSPTVDHFIFVTHMGECVCHE